MSKDYEKATQILTSKDKFHIELGLDRIEKILAYFSNPQEKLKVIHVAGTNGKGSTCAILNSILIASGRKIGLYTSPHLVKYTERIKINNESIPDNEFANITQEITLAAEKNELHLTEFEILTAAAYLYFAKKNVDIAIMETGLGGRLDATNAVKHPILTIITSISKDHTERLGNTIEKIAYEKAGIIKDNIPCVISAHNAGLNIIKTVAALKNSPVILAQKESEIVHKINKNVAIINGQEYEFSLLGDYQAENLDLALTSLNVLTKKEIKTDINDIKAGLKSVTHCARFDYIKDLNLIIDGAHNPDGAQKLRASLDKLFPTTPITFIYATINTKDYKNILKNLINPCDELILYNFKRKNAVKADEIKKVSPKQNCKTEILNNASEIIRKAEENAKTNRPTVLTGSLYAIGEIYLEIKNRKKYSPVG